MFRLLHGVDDSAKYRIAAEAGGSNLQHARMIGRSGKDSRSGYFFHWLRFTGDGGLVDCGMAQDNDAVYRDFGGGSNDDDLTRSHAVNCYLLKSAFASDQRLLRNPTDFE
jgi:hypothetical protein